MTGGREGDVEQLVLWEGRGGEKREGRGSSVETGERVSDTDGCNGSV